MISHPSLSLLYERTPHVILSENNFRYFAFRFHCPHSFATLFRNQVGEFKVSFYGQNFKCQINGKLKCQLSRNENFKIYIPILVKIII